MKKTRSGMTIGLGVPTVLVIFVVMGMCILSLLTYLEASQNKISTIKEVENVSTYYEADAKARYLIDCIQNEVDYSSFVQMENIKVKIDQNYSFDVFVNENRKIHVICDKNEIKVYRVGSV